MEILQTLMRQMKVLCYVLFKSSFKVKNKIKKTVYTWVFVNIKQNRMSC